MPSRTAPLALAIAALIAALPAPAPAQEPDAALPKMTTEVAFPKLSFDRPVAMAYPNDGSNRLCVVEQHQARICSFPNDPGTAEKVEFLKLPDPINRGNEEGLL